MEIARRPGLPRDIGGHVRLWRAELRPADAFARRVFLQVCAALQCHAAAAEFAGCRRPPPSAVGCGGGLCGCGVRSGGALILTLTLTLTIALALALTLTLAHVCVGGRTRSITKT